MAGENTSVKTNDFGVGSIPGNIIKMAVPITVAQLVNCLYNIVDRIFIGRIPEASTLALTGVGLCFPIVSMVMAFANLFGMGGAPLCSIARGAKENDRAKKIMGLSFSMLIVTGLLLTVIVLLFKEPLLYLFGASADTYSYASDYLGIYILGTVFVMISLGMNQFINSQGFSRVGMMTILLGAVVNIILDPVFIFVMHMGVKGAALATVISQILSALWVLKFLTGKKIILKLEFKDMHFNLKLAGEVCSLGMAGFILSFTNATVQLVCNKMLGVFGGDTYIAIMTVINSVREIVTLPVTGITSGTQPILGFNYGAKKYDRVKKGGRFGILCGIILAELVGLTIYFTVPVLIACFNRDPEIIAYGVKQAHILTPFFFLCAFSHCMAGLLRGAGKSTVPMYIMMVVWCFIRVAYISIIVKFIPTIDVVFWGYPLTWFLSSIAFLYYYLRTDWVHGYTH